MSTHATQMALFSVPEPEPCKTEPPQPVEGEEQVAYAQCLLGDASLSLANSTIPATISPTLEE